MVKQPSTTLTQYPSDQLALRAASTEDLRGQLAVMIEALAKHMADAAATYVRLATLVQILDERGEDLSDLRFSLIPWLRKVAAGQLAPQTIVRFGDRPLLFRQVSLLPIAEQERLAKGEPVKLVVWREGGAGCDVRMMDPMHMRPEQIRQVFGDGALREDAEQIALLERRRAMPAPKQIQQAKRVRADRTRGGILVGRQFAPVGEVLAALVELRGGDPLIEGDGEDASPMMIPMTATEHQRIKVLAARSGCPMTALVRRAMLAHGLLDADG